MSDPSLELEQDRARETEGAPPPPAPPELQKLDPRALASVRAQSEQLKPKEEQQDGVQQRDPDAETPSEMQAKELQGTEAEGAPKKRMNADGTEAEGGQHDAQGAADPEHAEAEAAGEAAPSEGEADADAAIDEAAAKAEKEAPGEGAEGQAQEGQQGGQQAEGEQGQAGGAKQVAGGGGHAGGGGGAAPGAGGAGGGGMCLAPWSVIKGGIPWDQEIAHHDAFKEGGGAVVAQMGGGGGGGGGGAEAAAPQSRGDMVTAALAGGAWSGLQNGLVSVGIDVAATAAAKKIPYVAGFIEVGRLAYDPKAWLDTTAKGLVGGGKFGSGIDKIASGNPIDIIEGVLDIGTGINQIVGTISSILWIVAAAGFIVSLFFPALLPFVALAAKWAALLGTVSATLGLALQALRPIVIGLRAVDILYLESDPAAAEAKAAGLQDTTAAFAADWTARSGKAVRGRAAARRDAKTQAAAQGKPLAPPTRMPKPPLWSRIAGVMTGELGKGRGEALGGGFAGSQGKPGRLMPSRVKKDIWDDARNTAGATRDTFRARGTGERLAGLEARGVQTYTSQGHKDRVNRQLEQRGGKGARDTSVQAAEAQQRQAAAEQKYREASQRRNQTRAELKEAERRVREANQKVQEAQRGSGAQRAAAEAELNERKALLRSYQTDVRQLNSQMGDARTTLEMARSAHQANPNGVGADGVPYSQKVAQAQQRVAQLESQMTSARSGVREADALVAEGRSAVDRARAPIVQARQDAQAAVAARNQANTTHSQASQDRQGAVTERRDARGAAAPLDTETNRQAQAQFDARMQHIAATGGGDKKDYLHSQNPPDSSLGIMAKTVDKVVQQETAASGDKKKAGEALFDAVGGAFGGGDEQAQQQGAGGAGAGPGGEPIDHVALIQAKLAEITASLPSPPLDAPGRIDGAALAMEEVLAEEARLTEAKGDLQALSVEGQAQVTEMQGAKGMVEANKGGADALQAEADALLDKQTELKGKADETSGQATEGKASGSKGHGMLAPILTKMMQLFGMLPSKIAKGGGAGGKAKQLGEAAEGTTSAADVASEAAQAAGQEAGARTQATSQVKGGVDADKGALDGLGQQIEADQQSAEQGIAEVQQGEQTAEQELQTLAAEKTRLEQEHASQVQAATAWATGHQGSREGQMAELEALVAAAEAAKQ